MARRLFTSESVTEGHPDKMADQISDVILDAMIKDDPGSRVAVETLITTGQVHVAGEVSSRRHAADPNWHTRGQSQTQRLGPDQQIIHRSTRNRVCGLVSGGDRVRESV